tara:strand:- start:1793 stop:2251 length:459 start_codon:yes stop_codon:yes gene_type:complete
MTKMYSINKAYPVSSLPHRITFSDGSTKTDNTTFTEEDLKNVNIVEVDSPPSISTTQTLSWSGTEWVVKNLSQAEEQARKEKQWGIVRKERDNLISNQSKYIEQYLSEVRRKVTPTIDIAVVDKYVEELRQVPQKNSDPFNINWPEDWTLNV